MQPFEFLSAKPGKVELRIGKPLDFSRYSGMEGDRFVLRSITDEIMYELMVLSGQEYVDIYASVAKEQIKAARHVDTKALGSTDDTDPAADADPDTATPSEPGSGPGPAAPAGSDPAGPNQGNRAPAA